MLSRALILATVTFLLGWFGTTLAVAQNLEAGKPPSQIFSSTCSLCHKGARGLLKNVAPGSLPGFLRQHYTTSSDMAAAMSAYVLSNGAANAPVAGGNLTRQGQEAKSAPKPSASPDGRPESRPEQAARERKPPAREASRPDADSRQDGVAPSPSDAATLTARQKAAAERRAARQAARDKAAGKGEPAPKIDARHEPSANEAAVSAKTDAPKTEAPETGKTETAKVDGTRVDPVPAVTPAPKDEKPAAAVAALPPKDDAPAAPLTIDIGPSKTPVAAVAAPSGPPPVRAGAPVPPISR